MRVKVKTKRTLRKDGTWKTKRKEKVYDRNGQVVAKLKYKNDVLAEEIAYTEYDPHADT